MSVKQEPNGRRSVQVEVEVPGTPEQVWQAIASGPGISSWFVPTKVDGRAGGSVQLDFGSGVVTSATIVEWDPPRRFVAEDTNWLQGGPPVATEWIVEAKRGGTCVVRVVHSLFASTDDWDGQLEGTEHGWPGYFRVLRHYLEHHAGEPSASFVVSSPVPDGIEPTWAVLVRELGAVDARVGQAVRMRGPGGAQLAGTVRAVDDLPMGRGVMLGLEQPAPGIALLSAMDCSGMRMATLQVYHYGARASAAAANPERWQQWLAGLFPAAAT